MNTNVTAMALCVTLALTAALPVSAAGPRGGGQGGGRSMSHMSEQGQTNTNAQLLPDSNRGLDRAQERMSDQGLAHQEVADKTKPGAKNKKPETVKKP